MINEIGFKTQIKDLTVAVTSTVAERVKLWIKDLPVTDESAKLVPTNYGKGFKVYYNKNIYLVIVETFNTNLDDNSTTSAPFCTIEFNSVANLPLLNIEFEDTEGLYVYNSRYQFEDYTGFFKILNNTIGTTFVAGGELL